MEVDAVASASGTTETRIVFGGQYEAGAGALSLIMLPAEVMQQVQADPTTTLKFIGRDGEDAVLVTATRTYAVRKGETSNAQLLLPSSMDSLVHRTEGAGDGETTGTAVANVLEHYELHPTGARLRMLPALLAKRSYEGPDQDAEDDMDPDTPPRFSRAQLRSMFQASAGELDDELHRLGALDVDGKLCTMGSHYESNLMTHFVADAAALGWDLAAIRPSDCWKQSKDLASYPRFVLRTFFQKYKKDKEGNSQQACGGGHVHNSDDEVVEMDLRKMALFRADDLLAGSKGGRELTAEEFRMAWRTLLPAGVDDSLVDLETLRGRAVLENRGAQVVVKRFRAEDLSEDVKTRFKELFRQSNMWTRDNLVPYVSDFVSPTCTADQLLLKHTRLVRQPGSDVRLYTART